MTTGQPPVAGGYFSGITGTLADAAAKMAAANEKAKIPCAECRRLQLHLTTATDKLLFWSGENEKLIEAVAELTRRLDEGPRTATDTSLMVETIRALQATDIAQRRDLDETYSLLAFALWDDLEWGFGK